MEKAELVARLLYMLEVVYIVLIFAVPMLVCAYIVGF